MIKFYLTNSKSKQEFDISGKDITGFTIGKDGEGPVLDKSVFISIIDDDGKEFQFNEFRKHLPNFGIDNAKFFVIKKNPEIMWFGEVQFEITFCN